MDPKLQKELRILKTYAIVSSVLFAVLITLGATGGIERNRFGEIDVQRINIVEPDGTLRMVISDKKHFPGLIIKGKEYPDPNRSAAGMLFYDDEGTENGGLIFGGMKGKDGKAQSYGHLSFDRYDQDQTLVLQASQDGDRRQSGLSVVDRPDWPLADLVHTPRSHWKAFFATHRAAHQRIYLGRNDDKSASLTLKDQQGRPRIVIKVAADGSPVIQLLDQNGKVTSEMTQTIIKK